MGLIDKIEPIEELERFPIDTFRRGQNTLKLKFTNASDAGNFDCQVSTNPKISQIFKLNIIGITFDFKLAVYVNFVYNLVNIAVPSVSVEGEKEKHVMAGSPVQLKCLNIIWILLNIIPGYYLILFQDIIEYYSRILLNIIPGYY